jgi:hypothetical protein
MAVELKKTVLEVQEYEPISVPADKVRLIWPANTFCAEMIGDHVKLNISTDAAGIPSVIAKLEALQAVMAISINPAQMITEFGDPA